MYVIELQKQANDKIKHSSYSLTKGGYAMRRNMLSLSVHYVYVFLKISGHPICQTNTTERFMFEIVYKFFKFCIQRSNYLKNVFI